MEMQKKLQETIQAHRFLAKNAFLLEKKRRGVHTSTLAANTRAADALKESCDLMLKCLTTDEDREDFAKRMLEYFK